ncbi:MAG: signal peptidase I, partial [Planctomycetes bacterium]|nr:signal peptidase I [Planctomycetota bacterium]
MLCFAAVLLLRAVVVESYFVPTGSMAPTILGNHKEVTCPRCGYPVIVGRRDDKNDPTTAVCPNCGCADLDLEGVPECSGDRLLVDKTAFELRRPRRWEPVVFHNPAEPAKIFVKRVVGMPGETVQLHEGDLYINGALVRKSPAECEGLRLPVFDNNYQPRPDGWRARWLMKDDKVTEEGVLPPPTGPPPVTLSPCHLVTLSSLEGTTLHLDAARPGEEQWLIYRNWSLEENEEQPIQDSYGYNGTLSWKSEPVHDFLLEGDLEVLRGSGWAALGITDGFDHLVARMTVGPSGEGTVLTDSKGEARARSSFCLETGKSYHVELAFVDRRATLIVDGRSPFSPVDWPAVPERAEVSRPVRIGAAGVEMRVRNFRLDRDI